MLRKADPAHLRNREWFGLESILKVISKKQTTLVMPDAARRVDWIYSYDSVHS